MGPHVCHVGVLVFFCFAFLGPNYLSCLCVCFVLVHINCQTVCHVGVCVLCLCTFGGPTVCHIGVCVCCVFVRIEAQIYEILVCVFSVCAH